jgi:hypothetical protein
VEKYWGRLRRRKGDMSGCAREQTMHRDARQ